MEISSLLNERLSNFNNLNKVTNRMAEALYRQAWQLMRELWAIVAIDLNGVALQTEIFHVKLLVIDG